MLVTDIPFSGGAVERLDSELRDKMMRSRELEDIWVRREFLDSADTVASSGLVMITDMLRPDDLQTLAEKAVEGR